MYIIIISNYQMSYNLYRIKAQQNVYLIRFAVLVFIGPRKGKLLCS